MKRLIKCVVAPLMMVLLIAGCADGARYSGDVYDASQAKGERRVEYGTLISVRPVTVQTGTDGAVGGVTGAVAGGIAGNAIGRGSGRNIATAAGVILGSMAGSKAEHALNRQQGMELEIRKENGEVVAVVQTVGTSQFQAGQRVRLVGSGSSINVSPL